MIATEYVGNHKFSVIEKENIPPSTGEVQIEVAYCGVCGTDMHIYHGNMDQRVAMPLTIGHEMSGTITAIGDEVTGYSVGEKVVVRPLDDRGEKPSDKGYSHICEDLKFIGIDSPGAMQQYWNVPSFVLHKLSDQTDLKLAALVEPLAVACHDVRMAGLQSDETAVVLGGGPIGMLIGLVANNTGANVYVSEVNPVRIKIAEDMGLKTMNPSEVDIVEYIKTVTDNRLADVVFEVAGVQPTVDMMTDVAGIRGRIVMVAIHSQPRPVNLFKFFWKELKLIGARVYEKEDYEQAIALINSKALPLEHMVTAVEPLTEIQNVFENIDKNPNGMKTLLDCSK